ncbi:MAG TPA: DNA methyltransferase [Rhodothermales bacterium]|nr:DNA methyltransferase [Rhodothermales bacterium]
METATTVAEQLSLYEVEPEVKKGGKKAAFSDPAFAGNKQLPVHRWVPWIAGFASDFVQDALRRHLRKPGIVLDPFAGVGTTLVEAMRAGHDAIGFEINPYAALACQVKTSADRILPELLQAEMHSLECFFQRAMATDYQPEYEPPKGFHTRTEFFSPKVLRKVLVLWDYVSAIEDPIIDRTFRLAFASTMVQYSNYSYEPSLGTRRGAGKADIEDYDVLGITLRKLADILEDVCWLRHHDGFGSAKASMVHDSFFNCSQHVGSGTVDLLITSPPYLNNYHYVRNTRPHLYWLGFVEDASETKPLEDANFGKFWQTVRNDERLDLAFSLPGSDLADLLEHLRTLNADRGVYGGNGWANYAAAYFNDCYRYAKGMRHVLKPGATALTVLGNSIVQGIDIATDRYLGEIAELVGLEVVDIHTPRATRVGNSIIQSDVRVGKAKNGRQLYEAVVEVRKP